MRGVVAALVAMVAAVCMMAMAGAQSEDPYVRAQNLLKLMTLEEKLAMLHGYPGSYVGNVIGNPRLGIPALSLEDGPQGVADGVTEVTAWPSALTVVATWDRELMQEYGAAMGQEQALKGTNVMLGPMINLARVPLGGRNFESFGEDPFLAGEMAKANIIGVQSQHVIGCAKHFLDNNQEYNRTGVSAAVDERTQYELYYPAFQASVEAGVGSIMCSYNRVNDTYACENAVALTRDLKETMGFRGWVMSDWGATHSTVQAALAGLDQQMPDDSFFGDALAQAVASGQVSQDRIDDMVLRMLYPMFAVGLFDYPGGGNIEFNATSVEHALLARQLAAASTVLLQNNGGLLPLDARALRRIAVIGDQDTVVGGGSGHVIPPYVVTPQQGMAARTRLRQPNCSYEQNIDYYQEASPSVPASSAEDCCAACSGIDWCNYFTWANSVCYVKRTNDGRRSAPGIVSGACGPWSGAQVTYNDGSDVSAAAAAAASADVAVVVLATTSSEGSDRTSLGFGDAQDDLVFAVAKAQPRTVVVLRNPGAVTMPWRASVPAIVAQFMPGQEAGNALADVLFGDVNPSGRLPVTFPNSEDETWLKTAQQYPGIDGESVYSEGLLMGYRWYDAHQLTPLFPFGHGLSYTTFQYSSLSVQPDLVTFAVTNSGSRAGAEVAQVYIGYPAGAGEPPKLLRGFEKVFLLPGETEVVKVSLTPRALSVWDVPSHSWMPVRGTFTVFVGASASDIRLTGSFTV